MKAPAEFVIKVITLLSMVSLLGAQRTKAQTVTSFNFSAASQPVSGWINVTGDPSLGVQTATDPATGITISSVATANWSQFNSICAFDGLGATGGSFFPAAVLLNHWFNYDGTLANYQPAKPQFQLTGLNKSGLYTIRMAGSTTSSLNANPTRYTVAGSAVYAYSDANNHNNTLNGATFNNVSPDSTGTIKVYVNTITGTDVADISGLQISRAPAIGLTAGEGLAQNAAGALSLGDSVTGSGPHNFNSHRYQFLNGHMYSIGGSVNDPVTHPALRVYDNGDLTAGTTMDRSVLTNAQTGFRYYAKQGILQIGGSDRVDTTQNPIVYGHWPSSALIINSDDSNMIKGKLMNTVFAADITRLDSGNRTENCFIATEASHFTSSMNSMIRTVIGAYGLHIAAPVDACFITGHIHQINYPILGLDLSGYSNVTQDTVFSSLIGGALNKFGGVSQFVAGQYLVNRTPAGATLGNSNVDFATLNYTGSRGTAAAGISGYPLFALGNGAANDGSIHSNAVTVLFNGRTQINSAGFTNNLAQTDVTPKAALEVVSTNSGVLLPKLTNAQRNAIVTGDLQNGLLLYNTDSSSFQFYNGSAWTSVGSGSNSGHWQFSAGVQYDSVNSIAIGTNNPQGYKLAVNGTAIFTQIKVKPFGSWPDYVFNKGYDLPDLAKLERYIGIHKHLPGIASQTEIQRDGIDVGGSQAALLKKVEELTLYLIDEHKKSQQQEKEIEQLKAQNKRLDSQQQEIDQLKEILKKLTDKN